VEKLAFIEFHDVSYATGGVSILSDINFTVEKGDFVAVLGSNGSGKSTLAKLMNGLLLPSSGEVTVMGLNTKNAETGKEIRKKIGIVFQNPDNQIVAAMVEDDVAFGPENLNVDSEEIERRIISSLETVGLLDKRKAPSYTLSGGQKQKVAIAGALAMNTVALILDEATTMLDPESRKEVFRTILDLNKKNGITIIYITHFTEEILEADKAIVLDNGKIVAISNPKELFAQNCKLNNLNLKYPFAYRVAEMLRKRGVSLSVGIYTEERLLQELKGIFSEGYGNRN